MAALRRIGRKLPSVRSTQITNPNLSSSLSSSPILASSLISRRGIASKLFIGAKVVYDKVSEKSKGFGFITYASQDKANKALEDMNGKATILFHWRCTYSQRTTRAKG
ncbi:Small RNA-binding protein 11, chloroplastic-like protein [Drosera capensis]